MNVLIMRNLSLGSDHKTTDKTGIDGMFVDNNTTTGCRPVDEEYTRLVIG